MIYAGTSSYQPAGTGQNDLILYLDIQFLQNGTWFMFEATDDNPSASTAPGIHTPNISNTTAAFSPWSLWGYWKVGP